MAEQERNLSVIHAWNAAFNRQDRGAMRALWADGARERGAHADEIAEEVFTLFPDAALASKEIVAVGDSVIDRTIFSGAHRGVGRLPIVAGQMVGAAGAGKSCAVQHIHWWTLKDGRIVDHHAQRDDIAMLMQLGLAPYVPMVAEQAYVNEPPIPHRHVSGGAEQERNIAAIRANMLKLAEGDLEGFVAGYSDTAINHGRAGGRERMRFVGAALIGTYTRLAPGDGLAETAAVDDCVIARTERNLKHTGTPKAPIDGGLLMERPPTNKTFIQRHIHWWTLKDGLIVSHRACRDDVGMMVQLGLMAGPA